jgi:hypothetical protein
MALGFLPTFWSVKQDPQRYVAGEVFEAMFDACGGEQNVGWTKLLSMFTADILTCAGRYKINFVARVWFLWIDTARRIDLNQQTPVLKNGCEALAIWSGQTLERFGYSRGDTRVG